MAKPPEPEYDFKQTMLQDHKEVARAIGQYHAAFAVMEHELYFVYARVLSTDIPGALTLLGTMQSFSAKTEAIKQFVKHSKLSDDDKKDCSSILAIANACNSYRNKLSHGQFGITPEDVLQLVPYSTSTGRSSTPEDITDTSVDQRRTLDIYRLRELIEAFRKGERFPPDLKTEPTLTRG